MAHPPVATISRTQVHTLVSKLRSRLSPAVRDLVDRLLQALDDDGSVSVKLLHERLFPLAETKSASAQLSKLLANLLAAADAAGLQVGHQLGQLGAGTFRLGQRK